MVLLTLTPTAKAALQEYHKALPNLDEAALKNRDHWEKLSTAEVGTPVDHHDLLMVAKYFAAQSDETSLQSQTRRLDVLLRGAAVYQPPPPQKSEPVSIVFIHPRTSTADENLPIDFGIQSLDAKTSRRRRTKTI
jgi:hypothetical protein